jgi:hypothetical protein
METLRPLLLGIDIKCQCIGKELDLKVNGLMFCGVLFMLLFPIWFGNTLIFLKHAK